MGYTMGFFSYASNSTMNFHGKMTKSTIRFRGNYPIFRQTQMSTVMMEIAQIGIVIKHIGDFEEENRAFQATSSNTCLRLCQWESEFKIGSPWVFGSESVECRANVCQFESSGN